jgi:thiol-disulfide isomerase/thioredoxin
MRLVGPLALSLVLMLLALAGPRAAPPFEPDTLYVFWTEGCPVCIEQKPFLEELDARYPGLRVQDMELSRSIEFHVLFERMAAARGIEAGFVPTLFFRDRAWVGDGPRIRQELEQAIAAALDEAPPPVAEAPSLRLPWIGEIDTR